MSFVSVNLMLVGPAGFTGLHEIHRLCPKTQQGVSGSSLSISSWFGVGLTGPRSSKGSKVIQTTEFLKQTVNTRDKRILNDLMHLIGNPHMFVCVGVDLMCHRYYIRYSNKFWHVSPKMLGRMFGYFWMTGSFFNHVYHLNFTISATSGFELWSSRQIGRT